MALWSVPSVFYLLTHWVALCGQFLPPKTLVLIRLLNPQSWDCDVQTTAVVFVLSDSAIAFFSSRQTACSGIIWLVVFLL